ncbi:VanZ family protein [Plebeiibacterium marinum]|uniref:VanZ family protein n=1 Tax=Plebeiibacterium marinum TaxID=2992111 RepID=UPI00341F2DC0
MHILKTYWRTLIVIAFILFLSLINVNKITPNNIHFFKHFDKFAHFIMYFGLSLIFFLENYKNKYSLRKFWIIIDTISFGILVEFLQLILTNIRTANFFDAVFNSIGVIFGAGLFLLIKDSAFVYKILLFKKTYYNK